MKMFMMPHLRKAGLKGKRWYISIHFFIKFHFYCTDPHPLFSAECTIGMVWGLTSARCYGTKAIGCKLECLFHLKKSRSFLFHFLIRYLTFYNNTIYL